MDASDLIAELAQRKFTANEAELIVSSTFDVITWFLRKGQDFTIRDFGRFSTEPSPRYKPKPGDHPLAAPIIRVPWFHPSKKLKSFDPPTERP